MMGKVLLAVVTLLIAIIIGVLVWNEINGSLGYEIDSTAARKTTYNSAWGDLNDTAVSIFGLAPIIGIVLVAAIILGVITRFGSGGGL